MILTKKMKKKMIKKNNEIDRHALQKLSKLSESSLVNNEEEKDEI